MARRTDLCHCTMLLALAGCTHRPADLPRYAPAASHQTERYGLSQEESARRLNNEQFVGELNTRLHDGRLPYFSSLWIQHEPSYAIMVAFTRPPNREALLKLANPAIRGDVRIVTAKRTIAQIHRDQDRLTAALQGAPGDWSAGYNPRSGKFDVTMGSEAALDYARKRIPPDILTDVDLKIGPTPVLL